MLSGFADLAVSLSNALGGPYHDATVSDSRPTLDAGGSVAVSTPAVTRTCKVQIDACNDAMRREDGFQDRDVRILVMASTLAGDIDQSARLTIAAGPAPGTYTIMTVSRDPAGVLFDCRGRKS